MKFYLIGNHQLTSTQPGTTHLGELEWYDQSLFAAIKATRVGNANLFARIAIVKRNSTHRTSRITSSSQFQRRALTPIASSTWLTRCYNERFAQLWSKAQVFHQPDGESLECTAQKTAITFMDLIYSIILFNQK